MCSGGPVESLGVTSQRVARYAMRDLCLDLCDLCDLFVGVPEEGRVNAMTVCCHRRLHIMRCIHASMFVHARRAVEDGRSLRMPRRVA